MTKTLTQSTQQTPEEAVVRGYDPDEFEADTLEERPIALLAQKRRRFLAELTQHTDTGTSAS